MCPTQIANGEVLPEPFSVRASTKCRQFINFRYRVRYNAETTCVTMVTPLLWTHERITWVGVAPRRVAAAATAASTGPPGDLVIGLPVTD